MNLTLWALPLIAMLLKAVIALQSTRQISVNASSITGQLRADIQGSLSADSDLIYQSFAGASDLFYDFRPEIGALFPEYGIKHVLIYNFPTVFYGWGKPGLSGDPLNNDNYNWTDADEYVRYVQSNGAKAIIQFQPDNGTNPNITSPPNLGDIAFMITDRYMNGAHNSGFADAIELFEFYPETDLLNSPTIYSDYEQMFAYFSNFSNGVARASSSGVGVGAWGSNRFYPTNSSYSTYDPFITQFYKDCRQNNVPIKAATFHFVNLWFSFNPYDIKTITDEFRKNVLVPAGLPDLEIWATHSGWSTSVIPTTQLSLEHYRDPQFFSSFNLAVLIYAQDTSIQHTILYPGLSYGGWGAGGFWYQGFFNKSASDQPIPRNIAIAWLNYMSLLNQTPNRLELSGSSADGFAAIAGRSDDNNTVQVFLNNYQLDYEIPREILTELLPYLNASTLASPPEQSDGLMNGDQACFSDGNDLFRFPSCVTFAPVTERNNTSNGYRLHISDLPWNSTTRFYVDVQRVGGKSATMLEFRREGQGNTIDLHMPFPVNAQDLVTIIKA